VLTKRVGIVLALVLMLLLLASPAALADDNTGAGVGIAGGIGSLCCVGIWLCIWGYMMYFVYTDATARGQNAVLWVVLVFFFSWIAFVAWLVMRPAKP
jgi:hypothetical protein